MNNSIQIFSADFRKNVNWDLPYIRLGNFQSDAIIKITGEKFDQLQLAEAANIFWVHNNYMELGNPEYVGFCQYRRFFINSQNLNNAITTYPDRNIIAIEKAMTPMQQYIMLNDKQADGIVPFPFLEDFLGREIINKTQKHKQFTSLAEYFYTQLNEQNIGITLDMVKFSLNCLFENSPNFLQTHIQQAYTKLPVYFGSIFTLKKKYFMILALIVKKTLYDIIDHFGVECFMNINFRALGYLNERLCSCIIHAFINYGAKLLNMPLVVLDEKNRTSNRTKTCKEILEEYSNV